MELLLAGSDREVPYPVDPHCRLLSARRKRQSRSTAKERNELAPSH